MIIWLLSFYFVRDVKYLFSCLIVLWKELYESARLHSHVTITLCKYVYETTRTNKIINIAVV